MDRTLHDHDPAPVRVRLPDTPAGCRERLAELQDEIASIRIQIATTDIRRQADKKTLDAGWYHRAKTALRLKQQERAAVSARLAQLTGNPGARGRDRFKDALIEVVRDDCDDERWSALVARARERCDAEDIDRG